MARGWAGEDSRAPADDGRGRCTNMETITMSPRASATNKFPSVKLPSQVKSSAGRQGKAGQGRHAGRETGRNRTDNEPGGEEVPG